MENCLSRMLELKPCLIDNLIFDNDNMTVCMQSNSMIRIVQEFGNSSIPKQVQDSAQLEKQKNLILIPYQSKEIAMVDAPSQLVTAWFHNLTSCSRVPPK